MNAATTVPRAISTPVIGLANAVNIWETLLVDHPIYALGIFA
jgi:hypothetical protein